MEKKLSNVLLIAVALSTYLNAIEISDKLKNYKSLNKANDLFQKKSEQFKSINLKSMGIDGLDYDNVANVNMSVFKGFLSSKCDFPLIPNIPTNFCENLFKGDFNIFENLNLGLCSISGDTSKGDARILMDKKNEYIKMAKETCQKGAGEINSFAKWTNDKLLGASAEAMDTLASVSEVNADSEFLGNKKVLINDYKLPNKLNNSDIIKPKGVMGFDKIYNNDKKIPTRLREAYFKNDYATYSAYERYAKTTPAKNSEIDLTKATNDNVPDTYLDYMQQVQVGIKESFASLPTVYEYEKKLTNEFNKLQKDNKLNLDTSKSSIEMKAEYMAYKKSLSDKFMDINSDTTYKKMINGIKKYENISFAEQEEEYKLKNSYIIQASKLKVETVPTNDRFLYAEKIRRQQEQEIRRGANFLRNSKNKQDLAKLIAEKVFIANFEFNSTISQKEIEEILTQVQTQGTQQ